MVVSGERLVRMRSRVFKRFLLLCRVEAGFLIEGYDDASGVDE